MVFASSRMRVSSALAAASAASRSARSFARELGVDRQPYRAGVVAAGQLHRELDAIVAAGTGRDVGRVLFRCQHLFQQRAELHLTEDTARLDVGQHALQIADAGGQRLHLAETLVHLFEPFTDLLERFAQALLQGLLQFLVHHMPHLVELAAVLRLQVLEPVLQRLPDLVHALRVGFGELPRLLRHQLAEGGDLRSQFLAQP
jgi:hypothetical protein